MKKAYLVYDEESRSVIVFEEKAVAARRKGAAQLDVEFKEVKCQRAPDLDKYSDAGEVPKRVLVESHGWWFECNGCGTIITNDEDEDDDGNLLVPHYPTDDSIFCSRDCYDETTRTKQETDSRCEAAKAEALKRWPGISVIRISGGFRGYPARVDFRFPGGKFEACWEGGDPAEHVEVARADVEAWNNFVA